MRGFSSRLLDNQLEIDCILANIPHGVAVAHAPLLAEPFYGRSKVMYIFLFTHCVPLQELWGGGGGGGGVLRFAKFVIYHLYAYLQWASQPIVHRMDPSKIPPPLAEVSSVMQSALGMQVHSSSHHSLQTQACYLQCRIVATLIW